MMDKKEVREWIQTISVGLIPLAVGFMGYVVANSNAKRDVNAKMVEIAAGVLTGPAGDSTRLPVRQWAVDVMKRYSEVPFNASPSAVVFILPSRARDPGNLLAALLIEPKEIAVLPGQQVDLVAVGLTHAGDTIPVSLIWSATGGTIVDTSTSRGRHYVRFRAGARGLARVVATTSAGFADTAFVQIRSRP